MSEDALPATEQEDVEADDGEHESSVDKQGRKGRKDEAKEREKNLRLLKEYLDKLPQDTAYKTSAQTEILARIHPQRYVQLHQEFGYVLAPKGRARRIKRKAENATFITTEELQGYIQKHAEVEARKKAAKKDKERVFKAILKKLENQCHELVMKEVVDKFAIYMSNKCTNYTGPPVMTESAQRLTRGLVCNMYLSLGIDKRPCNVDQSLYETVGLVLCEMILQALYITKYLGQESKPETPQPAEKEKKKCFEEPKKAKKKRNKKSKATYRKNMAYKQRKLPREFTEFMRLTRGKCTEFK